MFRKWLIAAFALASALAGAQTTQPILQPHITLVDAAGLPCTGCKLYSYSAGTTTPLATYTDASGVTPNTNPVILDVAGGAQIWLGNHAYKFILKTALGSTIWTVDNVSGYLNACTSGGCTFSGSITGTTATFTGAVTTAGLVTNGPYIDPRYTTYGAKCDWNGSVGTDDTAAFQAAATAANALYVATGSPINILVPKGCEVAGTVTYGSGVHWIGPGTIIVPNQSTPSPHATLLAQNADNIEVDNVTINVITPCPGNNAACFAMGWQDTNADSTAHAHAYFRHNTVINANWGILVGYYVGGSGSLTDVSISDNTVSSPAGSFSNADGIHVAGRVTMTSIVGNRVSYRGDAGIALTSEGGGTYVQSGATISGNVLKEDRVGIDCSGCTNATISGNFVRATIAAIGTSDPAFREIYYNGYPGNVHTEGNYFENGANSESSTIKVDPILAGQVSWPNINSTFTGNTIGGTSGIAYFRGNGLSIANNDFLIAGGGILLDYDGSDSVATANVTIGTNRWQSSGVVTFGGGCALYNGVNYYPQQALGTLTVSNLSCIGTQTFSTPGDLVVGSSNLKAPAGSFINSLPGAGASFDFVWRDPANTTNHMILDNAGNLNLPAGWIATAQYFKMGGGAAGGLRNAGGGIVVPGSATDYMGSTATIVGMCEAKSMTAGNLLKVGASGGCADSGVSVAGLTGGVVNSINGTSGAFTFTGSGVSCTTTTCTFTGGGSGVTSVAMSVPSWLSVAGSPITTSGTLAVTANSQSANLVLASPNGSSGAPTFRALATADLPAVITATQFQTNAEFSNGTCTTAKTIDPANGNRQKVTLTNAATCALTFTQPSAGTATVQLKVIQSAVSSFTGGISGCKWPGGVVPTITQTTGAVDMVGIYLDGTTAYCQIAQAFN